MNKRILFALTALFATCLFAVAQEPDTYRIVGKVECPDLEGAKVYNIPRYDMMSDEKPVMDSTIIKNGAYSFSGTIGHPDYSNIYIPHIDMDNSIYTVVILEKGIIKVTTDLNRKTTVSGTRLNDEFNEFSKADNEIKDRFRVAYDALEKDKSEKSLKPEEIEEYNKTIDRCRAEFSLLEYEYVKDNINSPGAWSLLHNTAITASVDKQRELIAGADEFTKQLPDYKTIIDRLEVLDRSGSGKHFIDFTMKSPEGKDVSLSDYAGKGKYVLVDFWASWCGPCREEMPNVIKVYNEYKDKGLEIVGVSLDSKHESWVKSIKNLDLPWPHMSDLKGWGCEAASLYAVTGVPNTILIDKDGIIIARGLRGEELYKKLAELLK